jgi:hypothetical protein
MPCQSADPAAPWSADVGRSGCTDPARREARGERREAMSDQAGERPADLVDRWFSTTTRTPMPHKSRRAATSMRAGCRLRLCACP